MKEQNLSNIFFTRKVLQKSYLFYFMLYFVCDMIAWYEIKAKFLYHFFSTDALHQKLLSIHDRVMFSYSDTD